MKSPRASRLLRLALYIIFALGVLGTATLPFMLEAYALYFFDAYYPEPGYRGFIIPFLMIAAAQGLWVVMEMILMLRSVPRDPFIKRNVRALSRIGLVLMLLAATFGAKCLFYPTFLTMASAVLFAVCGLFAFTLAELFGRAVAFKEENDLTI